jgi:prepilin-type N-terminal cleavage/methylation domain-containing protein
MNRRGLTLIELLLAIGIVLIVGALVLPSIFTGMRERSFQSAGDVVRNQLLLARAHAQLTRRPVEVVYANVPPRGPGIRARYFLVDAPGTAIERPTGRTASGAADADPFPMDDQLQTNPDQVIVEGWSDRDLPDGLGLTNRAEADDADSDWTDTDPVILRLAVYMPDGSALLVQTVWLRDDDGRRGRIEVNPWTGLSSFDRVVGDQSDVSSAEEDRAEPELEPEDPVDDFLPDPPPDDTPAPDDTLPDEDDPEDEP